jgi:hypothetical protein
MNAMLARCLACFCLTAVLSPFALAGEKVTLQVGMDRMGADYKSFTASNAPACQKACSDDASCKAFTYTNPGVKGPAGMCFLKSSAPAATANACCTSGAKEVPFIVGKLKVVPPVRGKPSTMIHFKLIDTAAAKKAAEDKKKDEAYEANQKFLQEGYEQAQEASEQAHYVQQCKVALEYEKKTKVPYDAAKAAYKVANDAFHTMANAFYKTHSEIGDLCASGGCDDAWALQNYPDYQNLLDAQAVSNSLYAKSESAGSVFWKASSAAYDVCKKVKK